MINGLLEKLHSIQDRDILKKTAKYAFYLAVIIECLIVVIDKSHFTNPIEGRLFQITFALCVLKVALTKYDFKEYVAIFLACLLGLMVDFLGDRNEILRMFMFVAACKDIDIKKCLKLMLWLTIAGCTILAILSVFGIYGELMVPKEYPGSIFIDRYCFGMGNANAFHIMFFALVLLAMYVYSEQMKWWGYVILFVANIVVTYLTACKTGAAMTALAIVVMFVVASQSTHPCGKRTVPKVLGCGSIIVYPILILFSVLFAHVTKYLYYYRWSDGNSLDLVYKGYKPVIWAKIDTLLTGRIESLSNDNAWSGSLKTWHLMPVKENQAYFDLGFVRVFYWYGIIPATIILILILVLLVYLYRNQKMSELMMIALMLVFTFIESHYVSVYIGRNYALVILGGLWASMLSADKWRKDVQNKVSEVSREEKA